MISNLEKKNSRELSEQLTNIFKNSVGEIKNLADHPPENIVKSVHLIRKRLKFLRAFVKLTQFCAEEENYKPINYILRDCGRTISDCRDAHVRGLLLHEFSRHESLSSFIGELTILNDGITEKIETRLLSGLSVFDELVTDITNEKVTQYFYSLQPNTNCLATGHTLAYKKSYHAFHSELVSHKANLLHEWRKRTKDLQYQQEALLGSIPEPLTPSYGQVVSLCEVLGRINDLFMFLEWLNSIQDSIMKDESLTDLKKMLGRELNKLESQADEMGHSLFTLSPEEYSQKLSKEIER